MKVKGLRFNIKKMMFNISGLDLLHDSGAISSVVYQKGVNSIEYSLCGLWMHRKPVLSNPNMLPIRTM